MKPQPIPEPIAPHTTAPGAVTTAPREAYLLEPAWDGTEWIAIVFEFVRRFHPDDPVALLLVHDPSPAGQFSMDDAGRLLQEAVRHAGKERFAEILLVEPGELLETLRPFTRARWVQTGPDAGLRFVDPPRARA